MIYIVGLVLLLVVLAGVIAYLGDRLGTLVGRRRLSLFGARPRRTGQIVGVLAGIIIMLTTLAVLSLAFQGATQTLLNAQRTADQLARLRAQQRVLESQNNQLERQNEALQQQIAENADELASAQETIRLVQQQLEAAQAEVEQARADLERIESERDALQAEAESLQARNNQLVSENERLQQLNSSLQVLAEDFRNRILQGNETVQSLTNQVAELQQQLELRAAELERARAQFEEIASGDVVYRSGEIIAWGLIEAQLPAAVQEELAELVRSARAETQRRAAADLRLTSEQFNSLVSNIIQTPEADLVLFISPSNQFRSTQVEVTVESFENTKLFDAGQLIISRQLHLGSEELRASQEEIRRQLAQLVGEAYRNLRRSGVEVVQPQLVGLSEEAFTNQLLRLTGPVVVGVVAAKPVYRAGPAEVELLILY